MKKLIVMLLAAAMLFTMTGCCLKHDMSPATCTEPSTCTKCGKTDGSPLGHKEELMVDADPTCTENGSKGGIKCAVCGEILEAPEVIDAIGHDFAEATYFKPKTCRICGAEEGAALGNSLFENALFPSTEKLNALFAKEDAAAPGEASDEADDAGATEAGKELSDAKQKKDVCKTVSVSLTPEGFGDMDMILSMLALIIKYDNDLDGRFALNAGLELMGSDLFTLLFSAEEDGLHLAVPGILETQYVLSVDILDEIASFILPILERSAKEQTNREFRSFSKEAMADSLLSEENLEMINRYFGILISVANENNVTESSENYRLSVLGEKPLCNVVTVSPTEEELKAMLTELITTARNDEQLKTFLGTSAALSFMNASGGRLASVNGDTYAAETLDSFYEALDKALASVDEVAKALSEFSFLVAYAEDRAYALKAFDANGGIGFENFGKADEDGRRDALVIYNGDDTIPFMENSFTFTDEVLKEDAVVYGVIDGGDLALSGEFKTPDPEDPRAPEFSLHANFGTGSVEMSNSHNEDNTGSFIVDFKNETVKADLTVNTVPGAEDIRIPSGEETVISTMEELFELIGSIVSAFSASTVAE